MDKQQPARFDFAIHPPKWGFLPFLLVLIAAGIGENFLSFPLFLNIDFLFGSIFALLALQLFWLCIDMPLVSVLTGQL